MTRRSINILIGDGVVESDKEGFFGPLEPHDEWYTFEPDITWPEIVYRLGLFPSRGQAKKAGWRGEIPDGFVDFTFGKLKHHIAILKIVKTK